MEQLHQSHKGANQQNIDFGAARPALAATVRAQPQPHGAANCSARQRPSTAPPRAATSKPAEPSTQHPGKHSRYGVTEILTREGMYSPTPKVLRDLDDRRGFANRSPTEFLRRNEGGTLRERRQRLAALQADPPGRDPAFVKGSGSVNFSWGSAPPASAGTMFRKLRDIGTINFVMVRTGAVQNFVMWAKEARAGSWESKWSEDVPSTIADEADKWLPLFLDGIRELQEPYRFLAFRGSEALISACAHRLHTFADLLVPPLKAALDTREPTTVAVACVLMAQALRCDPRLAAAWVDPFWQFCQVLNLFRTKPYVVGLGYNSRQVLSLKDAVNEVLLAFQENGGPEALWVLRKYLPTYTPAVLGDQPARRGTLSRPATAGAAYYAAASPKAKAAAAAAAQELKPYTLI